MNSGEAIKGINVLFESKSYKDVGHAMKKIKK